MSELILENRQARFKYAFVEEYVAGIVLEGWEVKAIRASRAQMTEGYAYIKDGELWALGINVTPEESVDKFRTCSPDRAKKLLMKKAEIKRLMGKVQERGMTIVINRLVYTEDRRLIKVCLALAIGKNAADKREDVKERDWKREQSRLMKNSAKM